MTRIATVSYLNARPLIDGLEHRAGIELIRRVPSRLLETLEAGDAAIALCPTIDYQRSTCPLEIVPAGAIGCNGPALTVKLFSRTPIDDIGEIAVDGDSHTSVALLSVVLSRRYGIRPTLRPLDRGPGRSDPDALLLIGDKVITHPPDSDGFPHRLDLGAAWKELTGRPFVFATWMTCGGSDLGDAPALLDRVRRDNGRRIAEIAVRHAAPGGWPEDLAARYLSRNLQYGLGSEERAAMEEFWRLCRECGVIEKQRPLRLHASDGLEV
ncbi:MAG: menaquinone biosynthesis protein [Thermoanaerobaculales bacterium]|jgi:chorismate dehydratase|nr:menaquinone biosynthesis protein [Thermoanaerobaculales bacterium]